MTDSLVDQADAENFDHLFRIDLFWQSPDHPPIQIELDDGFKVTATNVSSYKGVRVWEVPALPGSSGEAKLDQAIAKNSTNRLVIFHDGAKQVWRWPSRSSKDGGVISRPARHVHKVGSADPQFGAKLDAIRLPESGVDVNDLLSRVRGAFDVETKKETKRASKLMAQMYAAVEKGYSSKVDPRVRDHEISVTLARVLFLLFGDDTEMWKDPSGEPLPDLFQDFIKDHTERDGTDIAQRLNALFETLKRAPGDRKNLAAELTAFPYVNGGIFNESITLPVLDIDFRKAILDASVVDWSTISPAIFGSMFQSVRDAQTRRELGEHYTSEENILKTLNPLFLDELRAEFEAAVVRETAQKRINALNALWKRLGDIRYMDPACGCGNFIIVAYRELRDLELRIMDELANNQQGEDAATLDADWTTLLKITLDHFYGIEIDEWPARIAETAMFLMDRQCDLKMKERFGAAPERLPIQKSAKIVVGSALRIDWADVVAPTSSVIIAGNPPFLGHKERSQVQGEELKEAWGTSSVQHLDYVTAWYAKSLAYFGELDGLWAFVSTNSVTQGEGVAPLFRPILSAGWRIKFAHRSFRWESEATGAAAVHVTIVGFARYPDTVRLFDYPTGLGAAPVEVPATNISPYLVDGPDVLVDGSRTVLSPSLAELRAGSTPIDFGHLLVEDSDLPAVRADPIASKFLRPYCGGKELINGLESWCLWMDVPGVKLNDLSKSPVLAKRISSVRADREASGRVATQRLAATPHLFGERRQPSADYLGIPQTFSDSRRFATAARVPINVIASIKLFTHPDPDGFLFALISSSMFITWQKTIGGRLKSDPSFSSSLVWNTFPVPAVSAEQRVAISALGDRILAAREAHPGKTLADLYKPDAMPGDLVAAHAKLDRAIDGMFGLHHDEVTSLERQETLFAKYLALSSGLLRGLKSNAPARKRARTRP
ncbi:MAG TPA: DNA methyltransferase [Nocardioidaceae bacterium]|nr:DNA methyltransferase [Nocardioidaceae bacterium]